MQILAAFEGAGVTHFFGVPDSVLKPFCHALTEVVGDERHHVAANEGGAVAAAAGHFLATGRVPVVYMQNSGLGNAVNPLLSLVNSEVFAIPLVVVIGWRGMPGCKDELQHGPTGRATKRILQACGIPSLTLSGDSETITAACSQVIKEARATKEPRALLVPPGCLDDDQSNRAEGIAALYALTRDAALRVIMAAQRPGDITISGTGYLSRAVHSLRRDNKKGPFFPLIGGMGHTVALSVGICDSRPNRSVWCIEGDGGALMHLGSVAIAGARKPSGLIYVVLNNGCHASVGGTPTVARMVDLSTMARAAGFVTARQVGSAGGLHAALDGIADNAGPHFLDVWIASEGDPVHPRPPESPCSLLREFEQGMGQ
ncbi:phosphonopyruvate decarboxylase [Bradyrhizobium sp. SZCCHNR1082]|nr:phosphonopyruvate decarboxylase [Bradyrhizobium sp. SZCCHNR1082]